MKFVFSARAWEDYRHWQGDTRRAPDRVNALIKGWRRDPFRGTGKPEPLSGNLSDRWSRRINREHRLVY